MTGHHKSLRSAQEQEQLQRHFTDLFERQVRFNEVLGVKVDSCDPAQPQLSFQMRPDLVGHRESGRLHGGVTASVLDAMGGFMLMCAIADKHRDEATPQIMMRLTKLSTIDLRIDFLRPGLGQRFIANGQVLRLGGRIGTVQMSLRNDEGQMIASATGAYTTS